MAGAAASGAVLYGTALTLIGAGADGLGRSGRAAGRDRRRAGVLATAGIGAGLLARMVGDSADGSSRSALVDPVRFARPHPSRSPPTGQGRWRVLLVGGLGLADGGVAEQQAPRRRRRPGVVATHPSSPTGRAAVLAGFRGAAQHRVVAGLGGRDLGVLPGDRAAGVVADRLLGRQPVVRRSCRPGRVRVLDDRGRLSGVAVRVARRPARPVRRRVGSPRGHADEEARQLTVVFAAPRHASALVRVEAGVAVGGTVVLAAGAGLAAWVGAAGVGADIAPAAAVGGAAQRAAGRLAQPRCGAVGVRMVTARDLGWSVRSPPSAASCCRSWPKACAGPPGC